MSANTKEARDVVVGYDGSPRARGALRFAAGEAILRRRPLRVVYVQEGCLQPGAGPILAEAAELVRRDGSHAQAGYEYLSGAAGEQLVACSRGAELVVVGRGELGLRGAVLGSAAAEVLRQAECPVVVVDDDGTSYRPSHGNVVVGVDPSTDCVGALAAAFAEAFARNASLVAVYAWPHAVSSRQGIDTWSKIGLVPGLDGDLAAAGRRLHEAVRNVHTTYPAVPVTEVIQEGRAGKVLLEVAQGARLVVVGSRGRGVLAEALLGSVGAHLLRHSRCPVLVARPEETASRPALLLLGGP